jgi:hypothetical protein
MRNPTNRRAEKKLNHCRGRGNHYLFFFNALTVQEELILLKTDGAAENDLVTIHSHAPIRIVEYHFYECCHDIRPGALVQKVLPLLLPKRPEPRGSQHELDCIEKVRLARSVAPDDHVVFWAVHN